MFFKANTLLWLSCNYFERDVYDSDLRDALKNIYSIVLVRKLVLEISKPDSFLKLVNFTASGI